MLRSIPLFILLAFSSPAFPQDYKMEPGPKSPQDSLKCIKARPGFKVELMVAEPLVMDPIAFAWGPDGKFWVVEMGDYPLGVDGKNKPGGKIKYLEKSKPDGPYDKMTLFMDNVGYPTGVFPYGKGVLVTCAPDIFYAEVGKDGKAAKKEILFTGFKEGNQQHRVNGLVWGIDNWIYGANGDSGGIVRSIKTGKTVNISGRDFRLKVETGEFEAVSGQSQFGRCRDDWGNWFGCNNSNPMFHFVLEDRYLKRNPHVLYPDVRVPVIPGAVRVYPISKPLPRFNTPQGLNHFTSACSTIIYRDNLFGKEFEGNAFVSEPVHNLVHREIMKPKGVTFTSQRADDEQTSEFLASSDNWFRPAMIQVGPDGALWIADMYRYVIEHPEWIPKDWQKKLDLRAGHDLGRIYRVYPEGKKPREIVRMDRITIRELADQYESPSGWVRDTAQQLINLRTRDDEKSADQVGKSMNRLAATSNVPQARLHALYYMGRGEASWWDTESLTRQFASDPHPAVRKHAIVQLEGNRLTLQVGNQILDALEKDTNPQVRQQLAYSLGESSVRQDQFPIQLARLLRNNADDPYLSAAAISSITKENWKYTFHELAKNEIPVPLIAPLLRMAKVFGDSKQSTHLFLRQLGVRKKMSPAQQMHSVGELIESLENGDTSLRNMLDSIPAPDRAKTLDHLAKIYLDAVEIIETPKSPISEKLLAMRVLGRGLGNDREDQKTLVTLLTPQSPDDLQAAVIQHLARNDDPRVPGLLLEKWKNYTPALRGQVLDAMFGRAIWTKLTLEAINTKRVPANEIDAIRRQRLLQHNDAGIRQSAEKIFAAASNKDRGKVIDTYWIQMPDKGEAARGAKLFAKACATCHKLGDVGQNVGPDLAAVGDKSVQGMLTAILDPNKAVESRYINYQATTKKGLTHTGILQSETSASITLVGPDGKSQQLLRNELEDLSSTGKSLMPEGLEKDLTPQDMADIIAHVRSTLWTLNRKEFPGNQPKTLSPEKDRIFRLMPASAAIFGKAITLEKLYGNLGYWYSPDDHAIWTIEVPKAGRFDVWIYYACANDSAGNTLAVLSGKERILHRIDGTGTWDDYRGVKIGQLQLSAGKQEILFRSEGKHTGALADLKKVELSPR